jgi:hypothetical protein
VFFPPASSRCADGDPAGENVRLNAMPGMNGNGSRGFGCMHEQRWRMQPLVDAEWAGIYTIKYIVI